MWHFVQLPVTLHKTCPRGRHANASGGAVWELLTISPPLIVLYPQSTPTIMLHRSATALLGLLALCLTLVAAAGTKDKLQIGVKYKPDDCPLKTRNGDRLSMQ